MHPGHRQQLPSPEERLAAALPPVPLPGHRGAGAAAPQGPASRQSASMGLVVDGGIEARLSATIR